MFAILIQNNPVQSEPQDPQTAADLASSVAPFLLLAGVVMLTVVLMGKIRRKNRGRSKEVNLEPKERIEKIRERSDTGTVLQQRAAETAALVRELTAVIDNRAERLELLIQHADERINRLESLSEEAQQRLTPRHAETMSTPEPVRSESTLATDQLRQQIYDLADQGHPTNDIAQRLGQHVGKVELILALRRA